MKAQETEEERRARRLAKKEKKMAKAKKREESYFGYTNQNNPFGDDNLTELFIWKKKYEQEGVKNESLRKVVQNHLKKKQSELGREIEKTRDRRRQRQQEQETLEALQAELAREREIEANIGWAEKEEQFHKEQCVIRSKLRIKEDRTRPVDMIARNIHSFFAIKKLMKKQKKEIKKKGTGQHTETATKLSWAGHEDDVDYGISHEDAVSIVQGLSMKRVEDLLAEVEEFLQLGEENSLWHAVHTITRDRKAQLDKLQKGQDLRQSGITNVSNELEAELRDKTFKELCECEDECKQALSGGVDDVEMVDEEYWQAVLNTCQLFKAKAQLREFHTRVLLEFEAAKEVVVHKPEEIKKALEDAQKFSEMVQNFVEDTPDMFISKTHPRYAELWAKAVTAEEDEADLTRRRHEQLKKGLEELASNPALQNPLQHSYNVQGSFASKKDRVDLSAADAELVKRMKEKDGLKDGELPLRLSVDLPAQAQRSYLWHEKYRPRKPKYFNKVKTGYSWNKYNQTHYDHDNPPPKIVQGYKFNIFYPDLIDPTKTPTYKIYEQLGSEYATIVFHAGPPYEDIAFKIVNSEIECNHKRGFRCRFEKGIFSLYFNFRRHRYRR